MKQFYFKMIKIPRLATFLGILFLLAGQGMQAADIHSTQAGNWSDPSTWGGSVPTAADNIFIDHNITLDVNVTMNAGTTVTVASGITLKTTNGGTTATPGTNISSFDTLVVNGLYQNYATVTVRTLLSGTGNFDNGPLVTGTTYCNSYLYLSGPTTTITSLTIGTSSNTVNYNGGDQTIKNNPSSNTYRYLITSGTGTKTLIMPANTTAQGLTVNQGAPLYVYSILTTPYTFTLGGYGSKVYDVLSTVDFPLGSSLGNMTVSGGGSNGLTNYATGNIKTNTFTIGTSSSQTTFSVANYGTITTAGFSSSTVGIFTNYSTGTFNYNGGAMSAAMTLNATDPGNTINYNSAGTQTIKDTNYSNLNILNGGGTGYTKTWYQAADRTVSGNLTISSGVTFKVASASVSSVTIGSQGTYSAAPTVTFSAAPTGGTLAAGTVLTSGTSPNIIVTGVLITNQGSGYTTAPTLTFSPVGATATATLYTSPSTYKFTVNGTTTNNGTITVDALAGTGDKTFATFTNAGSITSANAANFIFNNANYNGTGSQTVLPGTYTNLTLSNAGAKTIGTVASSTLCSGTLRIEGLAVASITNTGVGVGKLIVGGIGRIAGTYGGASSGASTIKISGSTVSPLALGFSGNGNIIVSGSVPNWTGATGNWSTTTNWSTGAAPLTGDIITIASGNPVLDTDFTVGSVGSLLLSGTGGLTVAPTATLSVTGTADFAGLPVTFKSDASGTARFGILTGTLNGATNVTVERFIPARRAFRLLSSPVTTATSIKANWQENLGTTAGLGTHITGLNGASNGFDTSGTNNPSLFTYDNANQAWVTTTSTTGMLNAGAPYLIMVRGDRSMDITNDPTTTPNPTATTLRATGTLKTGTVAVSGLSTAADGFSLIGNPFQSPVNMQATLAAATNLKNSYFVWDPTLGARGAYVARDLGSGTNSTTSNVDNYLQPGQACFVQTSTAAAAALSFTEANKYTTATNQGVMRAVAPISGTGTPASPSASIRLTLFNKTALANQGTPTDGAVVLFNETSSNEVDATDCSKMTNLDENLAFNTKGNLLSIEHRAVPTAADEIQLAITQYRAKDYTLVAQGTNVDGVTAYLVDQYTKTSTALPASGSINYNFTVDPSNANSSAANRFKIIFQDATSATEFTENEVKVYPNPSTGGMVTISLPFIQQESKVSILNFAGETIYSTTIAAGENAAINPNKSLAVGIYFVKMEQAGKTVTKKLIIK